MTKNRQIGKNSPKWLKLLKLGSKWFQGVPDGSRCQTVWARTNRGTYARAPYAFAALGQGPKGPELVRSNNEFIKKTTCIQWLGKPVKSDHAKFLRTSIDRKKLVEQ